MRNSKRNWNDSHFDIEDFKDDADRLIAPIRKKLKEEFINMMKVFFERLETQAHSEYHIDCIKIAVGNYRGKYGILNVMALHKAEFYPLIDKHNHWIDNVYRDSFLESIRGFYSYLDKILLELNIIWGKEFILTINKSGSILEEKFNKEDYGNLSLRNFE